MNDNTTYVFVDFDGTLINNAVISHECFCEMLQKYGERPITLEQYRTAHDMTNKPQFLKDAGVSTETLRRLALSHKLREEASAYYDELYFSRLGKASPRNGVKSSLARLSLGGAKLIIWSNARKNVIDEQTKRLGLSGFFSGVICKGETPSKRKWQGTVAPACSSAYRALTKAQKAHFGDSRLLQMMIDAAEQWAGRKGPWLRAYMKKHKIPATRAVVIGDTCEEPEFAHRAGAVSIALTGGYTSRARLAASRPNYIVNSWASIPGIVHEIGR